MIEVISLTLQQNTTSAAAEQIGNTFIIDIQVGTLLGFTVTLLASFGVWLLNKWYRRQRLRKAIVAELRKQDKKVKQIVESLETDRPIDLDDESTNYTVEASDLPPAGSLPTTIYQSNAANLGELPSDEVEAIVDYYSALQTQKATIAAIRSNEDVLSADKRDLHNYMPALKEDRRDIVNKLDL